MFSLQALDPQQTLTQYAHTAWSRENGKLPARIEALAQTPDGTLWLGTDAGLQRFDGVRFLPCKPAPGQKLASDYVMALAPAADGGLWIGTRGGLSHWKEGQVQNFKSGSSSAIPAVTSILVDHAGTVWTGTASYRSGGLCRVENRSLTCDSSPDHLPGFGVLSLFEDHDRNLWAGGVGVCRWRANQPEACLLKESHDAVYSIVETPQGGIWLGGNGLKNLPQRDARSSLIPDLDRKIQIKALLADRDGGLWIGTFGQGLLRIHNGRIDRFTQTDGLSNDLVLSLLEDKEGNIWVGTDGGLDRFREYSVTRISRREGLSSGSVSAVDASRDHGIWVGTVHGLDRLDGGKVSVYDKRNGLPSDEVIGVFEEAGGRLWTLTGAGLAYLEQGHFHPLTLPSEQKIMFRSAAETPDHTVWLSDPEHGLIRLQNARVADVIPWSAFAGKRATPLAADQTAGGLWLGFEQGEIAYYQPGRPVRWYALPNRSRSVVTDLHQGRDGALWIATESGLARFWNGHFAVLNVSNSLPCDGIRAVVEDDNEALWLTTDCGLVTIPKTELQKWSADPNAKLRLRVFDASDGVRRRPRPAGYFRRAAKSDDGRIWFADSDAIAVVDPARLAENRIVPPVRIETITAGKDTHLPGPGLQLPPLTNEVRIRYTAMSFVDPDKVRFRYRLDGFDQDWKEDSGSRHAVYTNLPPRRYKFRVIACNNDGVWNNTGASCEFSIQPAVYQTAWFQVMAVCMVGMLLWSGHRLRVRSVSRRLAVQYQTRLDERTRIAREMHDSLLQNLCGFALQLNGLAKDANVPSAAQERLNEIRRDAEKCTREAREFVWDLRAPTLEEVDLCQTLREAGEQITHGLAVNFNVTVKGTPRPAPARLQQQLSRIVQEATRNAVKYSQATEIGMDIAYLETDRIRLQIDDDGCGFDPDAAARQSGHWGLKTMQERAEQIGAKLTISSAPGRGTRIEIDAPITPFA